MLTLLKDTWERIQGELESKAGEAAYASWLRDLRPLALERGTCYLEASNRMACERVRHLFAPLLEESLSNAIGTRITVDLTPAPDSVLTDGLEVSPTRPVVDASNNTAFLVLRNLLDERSELPSQSFFFHGPTGVGKSFMMRWFADFAKPKPRIHDGLAIRQAFQLRVRDHSVRKLIEELSEDRPLVIDGLHRFSNHARAQKELLKVLLLRQERSLLTILTSRFHPQEIWGLDRGLQSVLLSGFVADIRRPGHPARLRYLRALEGTASRNGRASAVENLAREVNGSFNDLREAWVMQRHGLNNRRNEKYLKLIDPSAEFRQLSDRVAERLDIPIEEILGKSQVRAITFARQALAWLAVHAGLSQAETGRHMKGRSRATISYCIKAIEKRMAESIEVRRKVEALL